MTEEQQWYSYATTFQFKITCEACPVQIDGTIDGQPFYYRARHGHWKLHAIDVNGPTPANGDIEGWKIHLAEFNASVIAEGDLDDGDYDDGTIPDALSRIGQHMYKISAGRNQS